MKQFYLCFFVIIFSMSLFSQTEVSGNVSGEWTADASPYNVVGQITVPAGQTLHIDAGVTVNFQGYYKFVVRGNVQAIGTETDSINFIPSNINTGWHGIRIMTSNVTSTFSYCNFLYGKTNDGDYPDNVGGAVLLKDSDAHFDHCRFAYNQATESGYGIGGAIYAFNTTDTQITDCIFYHNYAYAEGGAIRFTNDYQTLVKNCMFIGNSSDYGGGAIHFYSAENTRMVNTLFYDNVVNISSGGAISTGAMNGNSLIFTNCTFVKNRVESIYSRGPAMNLAYAKAMLTNCIVYNNIVTYGDEIFIDVAAECEAHYNDMTEPNSIDFTGSNNINQNPMFQDEDNGDFHLMQNSPCIDTGIAYYTMENYIGEEVVTVDLSPEEYSGTAPDLGCFEFIQSISNDNVLSSDLIKLSNYPNPFNPQTTIYFDLPQNVYNAKIKIYNFKGEFIKDYDLSNCNRTANQVIWDGLDYRGNSVGSGIYFYRLITDKNIITKKMILLK